MNYLIALRNVLCICVLFSTTIFAQTDEVSAATGMPIPIGAPVIYGQVSIDGLPKEERRPNVFVSLIISGTQIDRRQTDSRGYFFFLQTPRHGHALVIEVDGGEVGRSYLTVGTGNRLRQDFTLDWRALKGATVSRSGSVSADAYKRSPTAEKSFDQAMAAVRENKNDAALKIFNELGAADDKDYLVWTMIGSIHYADKRYDDARTAYGKALAAKSDFILARVNYGKMEVGQKNYEKAIEILKPAVESDAASADANHYIGEAYLQSKKGSLAVGYLNKAIELAPVQKAEIHLRLATLYNAAGAKDRAVAEYKAFLLKVPEHPDKEKFQQYIKDNSPK